jgi:hypothetical protein
MWGISQLAEHLLASQERVCSMELFIYLFIYSVRYFEDIREHMGKKATEYTSKDPFKENQRKQMTQFFIRVMLGRRVSCLRRFQGIQDSVSRVKESSDPRR